MRIVFCFITLWTAAASAENASQLYNQGNQHYRNGNLGEAIYAYERALILDPGSSDIQSNLGLARKAAAAFDEENQPARWLGFLYWLSYNQWAKGILLCLFLLAIFSLLRAFRILERSPVSCRGAVIAIVTFILIAVAALMTRHGELDRAIVISADTKVRVSPFATADIKATLKPGQPVQIEQIHETWFRITNGWVSQDDVKPVFPRK